MAYPSPASYYYNQQAYGPAAYPYYAVVQSPAPSSTPDAPPAPAAAPAPPPPPPGPSPQDENIARLEKLILDQKREADEKEARAMQAAIDKAEADKKAAEDAARAAAEAKKAADDAAAYEAARADAEKAEADRKAAEEAAAKAAADLAEAERIAAEARVPPPQGPIKFKDAIGRKFTFPFRLCQTWGVSPFLVPMFRCGELY